MGSWAAVRQASKIWRASLLPELHGQPFIVPLTQAFGNLRLSVHNGGGGLAKGAAFILVLDGAYSAGHLGDGFIKSNEAGVVLTDINPPASAESRRAKGVLTCRDADDNSWGWNLQGGPPKLLSRAKRRWWQFWRTPREHGWQVWRRGRVLDEHLILRAFYSDVDLRLLNELGFQWERTE
jgi:hypothetical protein